MLVAAPHDLSYTGTFIPASVDKIMNEAFNENTCSSSPQARQTAASQAFELPPCTSTTRHAQADIEKNSTCNRCSSQLVPKKSASKQHCLRLIDEIWKGGLDHRLALLRNQLQNHQLCENCFSQEMEKSDVGSGNSTTRNCGVVANSSLPERTTTDDACTKEECLHAASTGAVSVNDYDSFESSSDEGEPPYKKAKFGWQIKGAKKNETVDELNSNLHHSDRQSKEQTRAPQVLRCVLSSAPCNANNALHRKSPCTESNYPASNTNSCQSVTNDQCCETTSDDVGQDPSSHDFQTLSRALGELSYLERWQCQHVAKSVIDNAINRTLEEKGLSPRPDDERDVQHSHIEDAGVAFAIRAQGLQRTMQGDRLQGINPIINRLTEVSENLFSQNLRSFAPLIE